MKNKINYSVQARRDLDDIADYIAADLGNPSAAMRIIENILNAVDQLGRFAKSGAPLSSVAHINSDYRFLVSGNYLIFYRAYGNDVYVDRILYGRRDYLRTLFEDTSPET